MESALYESGSYLLVRRQTRQQRDGHVCNAGAVSNRRSVCQSIDQSDACDRKYDIAIWSMQTDPPDAGICKYEAKAVRELGGHSLGK